MKPYYEQDGITIYHGDCHDVLLGLDIVMPVAVISDPPYGINAGFKRQGLKVKRQAVNWSGDAVREWEPIKGDNEPFNPAHLIGFPIVALFGANHFADKLPAQNLAKPWKWLLWDKRCNSPSDNNSDGELIWTNRTGALRIHRQLWRGICRQGVENVTNGGKLHPAQKPLSLMCWVIKECAVTNHIVVDPYAGSGTTLRAAKDLGLKAIGIEIEEKYCEIAAKRLAQQVLEFAV